MNKLYLSYALIAIFALPAFADIDKNASTATCDSATIGATSGTAYMDTDWTANTINLDFYSDGEKISTGSCTYDGAIELPEDPEDKTGYTFGGWKMRQAKRFESLSTWEFGDAIDYGYQNDSTGEYGANSKNTTEYGIIGDRQWATEFTNGTVRGIAYCSGKASRFPMTGENYWGKATDAQLTSASGERKFCWCKVTEIDIEKDGSYSSVGETTWAFGGNPGQASACAYTCASSCGANIRTNAAFRSALFGITQ